MLILLHSILPNITRLDFGMSESSLIKISQLVAAGPSYYDVLPKPSLLALRCLPDMRRPNCQFAMLEMVYEAVAIWSTKVFHGCHLMSMWCYQPATNNIHHVAPRHGAINDLPPSQLEEINLQCSYVVPSSLVPLISQRSLLKRFSYSPINEDAFQDNIQEICNFLAERCGDSLEELTLRTTRPRICSIQALQGFTRLKHLEIGFRSVENMGITGFFEKVLNRTMETLVICCCGSANLEGSSRVFMK